MTDYLRLDDLLEIAQGVLPRGRKQAPGLGGHRVFCWLNGRDLRYASVDEAEAFVLAVASGDVDLPKITSWIDARLVED